MGSQGIKSDGRLLARTWEELIGRASEPMKLRLILQPIAATIIAIRAGVRDARGLRPLYS
jgi:hypothetical protein